MIGERPLWEIVKDGVHRPYLRCPACGAFLLFLTAAAFAVLLAWVLP